ncbi:MAG: hypothetical protein HYV07_22710 [Deltaproteobacteria bacterium]|nr:hypothetical protein [Deltaproteobacteria bacterium]
MTSLLHVASTPWHADFSRAMTEKGVKVSERLARGTGALKGLSISVRAPALFGKDGVVVGASASTSAISLIASVMPTPFVLELDDPVLERLELRNESPLVVEATREVLRFALRRARAVTARDERAFDHGRRFLGLTSGEILGPGVALERRRSSSRDAVRAKLGLPTELKIVAIVEPIFEATPLGLISEAMRALAGVALLVEGGGPRDPELSAMALTARPSSPVIVYEPSAANRNLASDAADVVLDLGTSSPAPLADRRFVTLGTSGLLGARFGDGARAEAQRIGAVAEGSASALVRELSLALSNGAVRAEDVEAFVESASWAGRARRLGALLGFW